MGLSGAGKTYFAKNLSERFKQMDVSCTWLNNDDIRNITHNHDFSTEGRMIQAHTMARLANESKNPFVIIECICPLQEQRRIIDPDYVIWLDTVRQSKYPDTDDIFEPPVKPNVQMSKWIDIDVVIDLMLSRVFKE